MNKNDRAGGLTAAKDVQPFTGIRAIGNIGTPVQLAPRADYIRAANKTAPQV